MHYKNLIAGSAAAALMLTAGLVAIPALADTSATVGSAQTTHVKGVKPAAFGTVAAINGNLITLTSVMKNATTTYTVDATNATITKGIGKSTSTIAVSGISIGDRLVVQGTVSGTTITATSIRDGLAAMRVGKKPMMRGVMGAMSGRFAAGTVSSVSGSSFVIQPKAWGKATTTPAAVTVTTTSTTTFKKDGAAASLSDVTTGANVFVVGTKDSTTGNVVAKMVSIVTKLPQFGKKQ